MSVDVRFPSAGAVLCVIFGKFDSPHFEHFYPCNGFITNKMSSGEHWNFDYFHSSIHPSSSSCFKLWANGFLHFSNFIDNRHQCLRIAQRSVSIRFLQSTLLIRRRQYSQVTPHNCHLYVLAKSFSPKIAFENLVERGKVT